MAIATKTETVVSVTLALNTDEAQALRDLLARVGGAPYSTRRSLTDSILGALQDAGFEARTEDTTGTIYFV